MWKRSFRARRPSKSESWWCENGSFVRRFPQEVKVEDVKTKLSCETSAKSESWRCENEAFVRDLPEKVKVEDVKTKLSCETSLKKWKLLKMWKRSFCARLPWKSKCWRCENEAFVRHFSQKVNVEDVKTALSRDTSLKKWKLKMWKRFRFCQKWKLKMWKQSFRSRLPSKSESWRCENDIHSLNSIQFNFIQFFSIQLNLVQLN